MLILSDEVIFETLRDVLEAVRAQGLEEHRCLDQIVQAEIVLSLLARKMHRSFPSLRYLLSASRSSVQHARRRTLSKFSQKYAKAPLIHK